MRALKGTLLAGVILALLLGLFLFFSFFFVFLREGGGLTLLQFHDPARAVSGSSTASIVAALLSKHLTKHMASPQREPPPEQGPAGSLQAPILLGVNEPQSILILSHLVQLGSCACSPV